MFIGYLLACLNYEQSLDDSVYAAFVNISSNVPEKKKDEYLTVSQYAARKGLKLSGTSASRLSNLAGKIGPYELGYPRKFPVNVLDQVFQNI